MPETAWLLSSSLALKLWPLRSHKPGLPKLKCAYLIEWNKCSILVEHKKEKVRKSWLLWQSAEIKHRKVNCNCWTVSLAPFRTWFGKALEISPASFRYVLKAPNVQARFLLHTVVINPPIGMIPIPSACPTRVGVVTCREPRYMFPEQN